MASVDRHSLLEALVSTDRARLVEALSVLAAGDCPLDEELATASLAFLGAADKQLSRQAAGALSHAIGDTRLEPLLQRALSDGPLLLRWGAAFSFGQAGIYDVSVGEAALDALAAEDGDIRWAAAGIVREVCAHEPEFIGQVETAAKSGDGEQRKMALYCLRDLGHRRPDVYVAALGAPTVGTRQAALSGLQAAGEADARTVDAVIQRLRVEDDAGVRRSIAIVLGRIMGDHVGASQALTAAAQSTEDRDFKRAVDLALRSH